RPSTGRVEARAAIRSNPAARLTTTDGSGAPEGHRPMHAIALSTPNTAAAPGIEASSRSDFDTHEASGVLGRGALLRPSSGAAVAACAVRLSIARPSISATISPFV